MLYPIQYSLVNTVSHGRFTSEYCILLVSPCIHTMLYSLWMYNYFCLAPSLLCLALAKYFNFARLFFCCVLLHGKDFISSFSKHLSRCALITECLKSRHKAQICSFICVGRSEYRLSYTRKVDNLLLRLLANGYPQNVAPAQTLSSSPQMLMCNTVAYSGGQTLDISMLTVHKHAHYILHYL